MHRRILSLFIVFSFTHIFLMYRGFMPHPPKVIPVKANILSELTMKLRADYPEIDKTDAEIFENVLRVKVAYKGMLDDLKAQEILRTMKINIYGLDIGKSKYDSIEVSIFNTNSFYRYSTAAPLYNDNNVVTTWRVSKIEIVNDKEINSESIFKE